MRLTVLGACGAWPRAGDACSGFLVDHDGFRVVLDLGYATFPRLLHHAGAEQIDAVIITHGHPDHCADLNPLLRARALRSDPPGPLPVYALPGALDAVLRLDRPGMLDDAYRLHEFRAGAAMAVGPFRLDTRSLPHFTPNAGVRLESPDGAVLAYTGDCGPSPAVVKLARGADVLLAEASYADEPPPGDGGFLTGATQAARQALEAGARRLILTHLLPETDPVAALAAAQRGHGDVSLAVSGMVTDVR